MNNTAHQRVQALLNQLTSSGKERGLQVAVYLDGKLVVNAFSGIANAETGQRVDERTLFPVFSTTKGIAATLVHILAERGIVSYDRPIVEVWPEFGAHDKEAVRLRHALNHSSGVPNMPLGIRYEELCDWDLMCAKIADLKPVSPPGEKMEYHAMTYGWILGEVMRRADGRTFEQLLEEEIRRPLGIDTMFVGIPDEVESRVAILEEPTAPPPPPVDDTKPESVPAWLWPLHTLMNRPDARRACIPASNGIMNAESIARHYAALIPGGVDGVQLLPLGRVKLATEPQHPSKPQTDGFAKGRGLGYGLGDEGSLYGSTPESFGASGFGGSFGFADLKNKLAVGFTKNLYQPEDTPRQIMNALRSALGI